MNRISPYVERQVIASWLKGVPRDRIAQQLEISGSTVSEVVNRFPEEVMDLRALSVDLRRLNLSVSDAREGTRLLGKLADWAIGFDNLQSFIQTTEKMHVGSGYEPQQVVQSAMKLSKLEEQAGKSYFEAIAEFEVVNRHIEKQEQEERTLKQSLRELIAEKKKKRLATNKITEKEMDYVISLREDLRRHYIELSEVDDLQKYLARMQETGEDPRRFVEYTKKHDSLERSIAFLEQKECQKERSLQSLQKDEQSLNAAIGIARSTKSELDRQILEQRVNLDSLQEEKRHAELRIEQEVAKLSLLLSVAPVADKVVDALGSKQKELEKLNAGILQEQDRLQDLRQQVQGMENRMRILDREIQDKVGISDYVTQLKTGIAAIESRKLGLEKEASEKQAKIAVADTMTNFLLRSPYDIGQFCSHVEMLRRMKAETSQPALYVAIAEEEIRDIAMEAFAGHLMTKKERAELLVEQEKQKEKTAELNARIETLGVELEGTSKQLIGVNNTVGVLEAVKVTFEGRCIALGELRSWVCWIYGHEIERKVNDKLESLAVGAVRVGGHLWRMISHKDNSPAVGGQS